MFIFHHHLINIFPIGECFIPFQVIAILSSFFFLELYSLWQSLFGTSGQTNQPIKSFYFSMEDVIGEINWMVLANLG